MVSRSSSRLPVASSSIASRLLHFLLELVVFVEKLLFYPSPVVSGRLRTCPGRNSSGGFVRRPAAGTPMIGLTHHLAQFRTVLLMAEGFEVSPLLKAFSSFLRFALSLTLRLTGLLPRLGEPMRNCSYRA